jgi:hypothetical protein
MIPERIEGACLCGAIRYRVDGLPVQTTLCHCADCRRASGAPYVAWTFFRADTPLVWLRGRPKILQYAKRERAFCGDCGTPLQFFDPAIPEWFEMNTCSFDDPACHAPADECWLVDRIPWCGGLENLPKFQEHAPLPNSQSMNEASGRL